MVASRLSLVICCALLTESSFAWCERGMMRMSRMPKARRAPLMTVNVDDAAEESTPPPLIGPKEADMLLSGAGLATSITCLAYLEQSTNLHLFAPPMAASGIIFFAGSNPPSPKGFLAGTLCSATISLGILLLFNQSPLPPVAVEGIAAASLLMWYKTVGAFFPPNAVLAGLILSDVAASTQAGSSIQDFAWTDGLGFLVFPWLAGHGFLYGSALALAPLRAATRVALTQNRLRSELNALSDVELRTIFELYDTDNSGGLDADELKVALRKVLGADLPLEDCQDLVSAADADGNGVVDLDEFVDICREECDVGR